MCGHGIHCVSFPSLSILQDETQAFYRTKQKMAGEGNTHLEAVARVTKISTGKQRGTKACPRGQALWRERLVYAQ